MQVTVYLSNNDAENYVLRAFYDGCKAEKTFRGLDDYVPSDVAVIMGTFKRFIPISYRRGNVYHKQQAQGLKTVILETGYINRGAGPENHYAAGLDGLNGRAWFNNQGSSSDRLLKLGVNVEPWRTDGDHVLLCGQVPWDASVDFINFTEWAHRTAGRLQTLTTRRIVYRPHPLAFTPTPDGCWRSTNKVLADDLKNCWACVTFNSNSAVEAAIAGIPVFAFDEGSMALSIANISLDRIESPNMPDRTQWLSDLCYAQWTPAEMRSGETWRRLFPST